jgi:hypothetical protein
MEKKTKREGKEEMLKEEAKSSILLLLSLSSLEGPLPPQVKP